MIQFSKYVPASDSLTVTPPGAAGAAGPKNILVNWADISVTGLSTNAVLTVSFTLSTSTSTVLYSITHDVNGTALGYTAQTYRIEFPQPQFFDLRNEGLTVSASCANGTVAKINLGYDWI